MQLIINQFNMKTCQKKLIIIESTVETGDFHKMDYFE